ncbi:hydantoin utilization protein B, partial [Methylobacterium radiotolerans]
RLRGRDGVRGEGGGQGAAGRGGMVDGDVWLFNDPYEGGTHANDFKLVKPVFRGGKLFCFLASAAHWHDVGGAVPGNYNPAATECWQEAVQIPPVRIVARWRAGPGRAGHPEGQHAPARQPVGRPERPARGAGTGRARLDGLLDEYGDATVLESLDTLRERARRLMRDHIARLPDGEYAFEDMLDNDGVRDAPLRIALKLTTPVTAWGWTSPARRRPARVRSTSRALPPSRLLRGAQAPFPGCPRQRGRAWTRWR